MDVEIKNIKTDTKLSSPEFLAGEESEKNRKELTWAFEEHQKVKRLIDYFVLGLFMVFILYTVL